MLRCMCEAAGQRGALSANLRFCDVHQSRSSRGISRRSCASASKPQASVSAELPRGPLAAAVTPCGINGGPDGMLLAESCQWLLSSGLEGVALMGSTGEANSFGVYQRIQAIQDAADAGLDLSKCIVGAGSCSIEDTVTMSAAFMKSGAAAVMLLPPFYYKTVSDEGLFHFFDNVVRRVQQQTPLQVILYHFPKMAGIGFSHSLINRLIDAHPGVFVGLKDSSGELSSVQGFVENVKGDFQVFAGTEALLSDGRSVGAAGCISATANITAHLCKAVWDGQASQTQLTEVRKYLEAFPLSAACKSVRANMTSGPLRDGLLRVAPPLQQLSPDDEQRLWAGLRSFEGLGPVTKNLQ